MGVVVVEVEGGNSNREERGWEGQILWRMEEGVSLCRLNGCFPPCPSPVSRDSTASPRLYLIAGSQTRISSALLALA